MFDTYKTRMIGLPFSEEIVTIALCGRINSLPWLNTRSTEAEVDVMHKQQCGV